MRLTRLSTGMADCAAAKRRAELVGIYERLTPDGQAFLLAVARLALRNDGAGQAAETAASVLRAAGKA